MKELKFEINEKCKHCKDNLKYLKKILKRNKKAYGSFILHPISRFIKRGRDLGEEDRILGIILRPDYNSEGHLTHFHIQKEVKRKSCGSIVDTSGGSSCPQDLPKDQN